MDLDSTHDEGHMDADPPRRHSAMGLAADKTHGGISNGVTKKKRVAKACDSCRIKKTKCDGHKPCNRCSADNNICVFMRKKKSKEKHHAAGYVELLEARVDIVTKSLEKLVMLSAPHLGFLGELVRAHQAVAVSASSSVVSSDHDSVDEPDGERKSSELVLPINTLIACLIAEHGLLENEPIDWDSGVAIAAGLSPANVEASSRVFAEHNLGRRSLDDGVKMEDEDGYVLHHHQQNVLSQNELSHHQNGLHHHHQIHQSHQNSQNSQNSQTTLSKYSPPPSLAEEMYERELALAKFLTYPLGAGAELQDRLLLNRSISLDEDTPAPQSLSKTHSESFAKRPLSLFGTSNQSLHDGAPRYEKNLSSSSTTSLSAKFESQGLSLPYVTSPTSMSNAVMLVPGATSLSIRRLSTSVHRPSPLQRDGHVLKPVKANHRRVGSGTRSPYSNLEEVLNASSFSSSSFHQQTSLFDRNESLSSLNLQHRTHDVSDYEAGETVVFDGDQMNLASTDLYDFNNASSSPSFFDSATPVLSSASSVQPQSFHHPLQQPQLHGQVPADGFLLGQAPIEQAVDQDDFDYIMIHSSMPYKGV